MSASSMFTSMKGHRQSSATYGRLTAGTKPQRKCHHRINRSIAIADFSSHGRIGGSLGRKAQSRMTRRSSASIALSRIIFTGGIDGGIHQQMRAATFVAAFSQLLSNAAVAEGITSITTVHESFGHLPSSASRFRRSLRLSTVRAAFLNPFYFRRRLRVCWDAGQNMADATFEPLSVERGGAGGRRGRGGGWGSGGGVE
jgi:hypothetical protein